MSNVICQPLRLCGARLSLALLAACSLSGCFQRTLLPDDANVPNPIYAPVIGEEQRLSQALIESTGSLYQPGVSQELFSDAKAFRAGDVITILLNERTAASTQSSTSTAKDNEVTVNGPTLLGRPVTVGGASVFNNALGASSAFSGSGNSSQSNQLTGQLTVTVAAVLPNGNLVIKGEKRLSINQGAEQLRISGIVRPQDVSPDNTIVSTKVADAHVSYGSRGALADANTQGWLSRFFNSPVWPF